MSQNIKTITIYNLETQINEEKNIGVDAERVDLGESTLDVKLTSIDNILNERGTKLSEIDTKIETIENDIDILQTEEIKVADITDLYIDNNELSVGIPITSEPSMENSEHEGKNVIVSFQAIQNAFKKAVGNKNIISTASSLPTHTDNSPTATDYSKLLLSGKCFIDKFFITDDPNKDYNLMIKIANPDDPIQGVSNQIMSKTFTIVENDKINILAENEIILAEAQAYSNEAIVGKRIQFIYYKNIPLNEFGPKEYLMNVIETNKLIHYDKDNCPTDRLSLYSARDIWYENQYLKNCIKDLYAQIAELKNS